MDTGITCTSLRNTCGEPELLPSATCRPHFWRLSSSNVRFCHREGITGRDLRGAVGMPQVYRLADVPRSITWDEVRRTLEAVDR
jgi:hypothetical protein